MRGKRYIAVTVLAWLFIIIIGWYFFYDIPRMERAAAEHKREMASIGAMLYAENCVVCHGPAGEGVVGPPLNKAGFRADPDENGEIYDLIYTAINQGRPGTTDPNWVRLTNGQWASYTAMPTWGAENGGPMNEQMIAALTTFIMMGDWSEVGRHIDPPTPARDENGNILYSKMPVGVGISEEETRAGQEIFVNRGCVSCHQLGSVGGKIGPNLTKLGSWGLDREFLAQWIRDPQSVVNRAPQFWSNYGGPYQLPLDLGARSATAPRETAGSATGDGALPGEQGGRDQMRGGAVGPDIPIPSTEPLPPTLMPDMGLTEEEIETLVNYLLSLK